MRTAETVKAILSADPSQPGAGASTSFAVRSNPEFLTEGTAIANLEQSGRPSASCAPRKLTSSSINSIAAPCEATGADVREVARAIGADSRIGGTFLQAGPGFGGSCFQNNILNLVVLCRHEGLHAVAATWEQVLQPNTWRQHCIARLVVNRLFGTMTGKRIDVLGFAYGLRPTASTRPTPTTPGNPPPSPSAATCWKRGGWPSWIPR